MDNAKRQTAGRPDGGEYAAHNRAEADIYLGSQLTTMTPTAIDTELAVHHGVLYAFHQKIWKDQDFIRDAKRYLERPDTRGYGAWQFKDAEADIEKAKTRIAAVFAFANDLQQTEIDPIDQEFERRGGWTRFFLVSSSGGGHVHKSMNCSTCFPRTEYVWLTEESGKSEDEIVERAGDGACTVCYSSAPVADKKNPRPNPFEDPKVTAARAVREAEKAVRDEEKRRKGAFNPDGTELREADHLPRDGKRGWTGNVIKTERAAELKAVDYIAHGLWREKFQRNTFTPEELASRGIDVEAERNAETQRMIYEALAIKRGQTVDEVRDFIEAKAAAKVKRDSR